MKKIFYLSCTIVLLSIFIFAGRQSRTTGHPDGLDTLNYSGLMNTNKGIRIRDTFPTKSSPFLRLVRSSTTLTYFDSAGRLFAPEVMINSSRDASNKFILTGNAKVTGDVLISGASGKLNFDAGSGGLVIENNKTGAKITNIGQGNNINTSSPYGIVNGYLNLLQGLPVYSFVGGSGNNVAVGKGPSETAILIGQGNSLTYATSFERASIAIGTANTLSHGFSCAIGNGIVTTADNELIIASSQSNLNSTGFLNVYFGTGARSKNQNQQGGDVTIYGSGAGIDSANKKGGYLRLAGGKATGTGTGGDVIIATTTAAASGTTLQTLTNRFYIKYNTGHVVITSVPTYADNAAATGGGLATGTVYKTATGVLMIVY